MKPLIITVAMLAAINALNRYSFAELPPGAYQRLKSDAPEVLRVKILAKEVVPSKPNVNAPGINGFDAVLYQAEVVGVFRSKAFVFEGSKIVIESYKLPRGSRGFVGPRIPPELVAGREYTAYLKLAPENMPSDVSMRFELAAYGESFESATTQPRPALNNGYFRLFKP